MNLILGFKSTPDGPGRVRPETPGEVEKVGENGGGWYKTSGTRIRTKSLHDSYKDRDPET